MANLNLGRDVANKRVRKYTAAHKVANSYPLYLAVRMRRYGSLIKINPSGCIIILYAFDVLNIFILKRVEVSLLRREISRKQRRLKA